MAEIKQRVDAAVSKLDPESRRIIEELFGINGGEPRTEEELVVEGVGASPIEIRAVKEEALRKLAGYGHNGRNGGPVKGSLN